MKTVWTSRSAAGGIDGETKAFADAGVFDAVDEFFDALEAGEDVLNDHVDPHELCERLELKRPE